MRVMGLDISTYCGVSVVDALTGVVCHAEEISYPPLRGCERIHNIAADILHLITTHEVSAIVLEDYAVGKFAGSAIVSIELGAVIRYLLWQEGIPYVAVSPGTVKKFVTGRGDAKKNTMLLEVYKRFSYEAKTDNIADAVALAHLGVAALGRSPRIYTKVQEVCVKTLRDSAPETFLQLVAKIV